MRSHQQANSLKQFCRPGHIAAAPRAMMRPLCVNPALLILYFLQPSGIPCLISAINIEATDSVFYIYLLLEEAAGFLQGFCLYL